MSKVNSLSSALEAVYSTTDCSNKVHDWMQPSNGKRFFVEALSLGLLRASYAYLCDGDGYVVVPERYGDCYQLTDAGYVALTNLSSISYPVENRRFFGGEDGGGK